MACIIHRFIGCGTQSKRFFLCRLGRCAEWQGLHRGAAILSQQRLTRCERVQKDMNMSLIEFETVIVSAAGQPRKKDNERQGGAEADAAAPDAEAEAPAKAA